MSNNYYIPTAVTAPKLKTFGIDSTTATSITVRWSVSSDSLVDKYVVMWEKSNSAASVTVTITDPSVTTYTLIGLESKATYSITVTASNAVGSTTSTLGLNKLFFFSSLLFYSFMLILSTYYSFDYTYYSFSHTHYSHKMKNLMLQKHVSITKDEI